MLGAGQGQQREENGVCWVQDKDGGGKRSGSTEGQGPADGFPSHTSSKCRMQENQKF